MTPYFVLRHDVGRALWVSVGLAAAALLGFGYGKARGTGTGRADAVVSALQTLGMGAVAAGVSYGVVKAVSEGGGGGV